MRTIALSLTGIAIMTSCGSGSGPSSKKDSMLFGTIPGVYVEYQERDSVLQEKYKEVADRAEAEKFMAEVEQTKTERLEAITKAAEAWTGSRLDITDSEDFTVKTPVTVTFDGMFSKLDATAKFRLDGEIVAARDIMPSLSEDVVEMYKRDPKSRQAGYHVDLVGYDESGAELMRSDIGMIFIQPVGDSFGFPAGTPVKLETLQFSKKKAALYPRIAVLKLAVAE